MASTTIWNNEYVGTAVKTMSWSVPSGCAADSLTVTYVSGSATYLYWRDGNWKLRAGKTTTYSVGGTSGSETFFAGATGNCNATVSLSYHTVEAASTISAGNITLSDTGVSNSTVTISNSTMNIKNQNLVHKIQWSGSGAWGWSSGVVQTSPGATSATLNIHDSCAAFPTALTYTLTVTCTTYKSNGTTQIGSPKTTTMQVTVPQHVTPPDDSSLPTVTLNQVTVNQTTQHLNRNLPGITTLHLSGDVTASFGAGIATILLTGGGLNAYVSLADFRNGVNVMITQSGSVAITVTATDTRGFTRSVTSSDSFTYVPYNQPSLAVSVLRCNSNGEPLPDGTSLAATAVFSYTTFNDSITPENTATVTFEYSGDGTTFHPIDGTITTSGDTTIIGSTITFRTDQQYYIRATLTDGVGSSVSQTVFVGTAGVFMRWDQTHNAFGFGAYPATDECVYLNPSWELYTHGREIIDLIHPVGSIYLSVSNINPNTIFPGTSWTQIQEGVFLASAGTNYPADSQVRGEASHTLTEEEMPVHRHNPYGANAHDRGTWRFATIRDIPNSEGQHNGSGLQNMGIGSDFHGFATGNLSWTDGDLALRQFTAPSGGKITVNQAGAVDTQITQPHNNMPPYLAVYMWQRTN